LKGKKKTGELDEEEETGDLFGSIFIGENMKGR
jgi:hypothetical protein